MKAPLSTWRRHFQSYNVLWEMLVHVLIARLCLKQNLINLPNLLLNIYLRDEALPFTPLNREHHTGISHSLGPTFMWKIIIINPRG